eukprot:RCo016215
MPSLAFLKDGQPVPLAALMKRLHLNSRMTPFLWGFLSLVPWVPWGFPFFFLLVFAILDGTPLPYLVGFHAASSLLGRGEGLECTARFVICPSVSPRFFFSFGSMFPHVLSRCILRACASVPTRKHCYPCTPNPTPFIPPARPLPLSFSRF